MGLASGVIIALALMVIPGVLIAVGARLSWPVAVAVGPALTYGAVGLAIVPFGAAGIPWNGRTALATLAVVGLLVALAAAVSKAGSRALAGRRHGSGAAAAGPGRGPLLTVAAGVLLGMLAIGWAVATGIPHWQTIPSTWDAVWHANTVRFILDTGQASPIHMGELRNVETHAALYYPSAFHALTAVLCQLTGAAPTTAYTVSGLAACVWLFPVSAALLTWRLLRGAPGGEWRAAFAAACAAGLSASFTALPYVEFGTAAMPNLVGYGLAVPTFFLVSSAGACPERIAVAVLALVGVFSVHLTGGVVTVLLVVAWWLGTRAGALAGELRNLAALAAIAVPAALLLAPQLLSVRKQADIIAGHSFLTHEGRKSGLRDALLLHTRHLNDFPIQYTLVALTAVGAVLLLARRIWWPMVLWAVLVVAIVHASAPIGGPAGHLIGTFTHLFYNDPRRLMAMLTLLLVPMAGIALAALAGLAASVVPGVPGGPPACEQTRKLPRRGRFGGLSVCSPVMAALVAVAATAGLAYHYLPRHRFLLGDKYDQVIIDDRDLQAFAYLATLPGARDTLIGNANTDGTAWMYAVAGLHPLWTHYDYPQQQGPGEQRFNFWAYADDADTDPRAAAAVRALNIRYILISGPIVRGFTLPEGLMSLDESRSWQKIYDNGGARIYQWRGAPAAGPDKH
ncbi:MAG TPA: DUF6541 family protein [Mycobacterium sp.]|nr:DUF6541 family protein [Mycobacterium sp.]